MTHRVEFRAVRRVSPGPPSDLPPAGECTVYADADGWWCLNELGELDSVGSGSAHPDLAAHNTLGLATQSELDAIDAGKAALVHTHAQTEITNLVTDLAAKAAATHNHDAAYAPVSHTHPGGSRLPQTVSLGGYVVVTNVGASYDAVALSKGLGLAIVDFTGIASLRFDVFVNKVGTGTQDWQLWNVTNSTQIALVSDSGAAGDKTLTTTVAPALTGVKVVRVRAKSSNAADDPVYYGAALLLS